MEFRFVILGAGSIAVKFADAVRRTKNCAVAAVASKSMSRAKAFAGKSGIPAFYDSYEEMLRAEHPDCAYIATTCDSHFALSMLCIRYNVPVLCEKAMFDSGEQAEQFFLEADRKGLFSMEALWSNYLPAVRTVREWIASGKIGSLACMDFEIGFAAPRERENRYFNPALGGGAANDLSVYAFHLLPWVSGRRIESMQAAVVPAPSGVDETETVLLRMSGGLPATVRSTLGCGVEERMVVYGSLGRIVVPKPHLAERAWIIGNDGRETESFTDTETENGFTYEVAEVVKRIRNGETESPVVPHAATMQAARCISRIHREMHRQTPAE